MRGVRIVRAPVIEAGLARFDGWWSRLSRRERLLVTALAMLLGLVLLVYGVVKPIQAARADALADIRTYETLNARIRAAGTIAPQPSRREGPPEAVLSEVASAHGLTATVTPTPGGARAAVADGTYDNVLAWIADVEASTQLAPARVEITRRAEPGRVSATVDFVQ